MAELRIPDDPFPELTALAARIDTAAGVYAAKRRLGHSSKFRSGVLREQTQQLIEYSQDHCRLAGDAIISVAARGVPLLCNLINPDAEHEDHDETIGYGAVINTDDLVGLPPQAEVDAVEVLYTAYEAAHSDADDQPQLREVRDKYLLLWHLDEAHYVDVLLALVSILLALHEGKVELKPMPNGVTRPGTPYTETVEDSDGNAS